MPDDSRLPSTPVPGGGGRNPLERIAILERFVLDLEHELAQLRSQVGAPRASPTASHEPPAELHAELHAPHPAPPHAPAPAAPPAAERRVGERREGGAWRPAWTTQDLEGLVGRYGMLALATVAALAAVGTFLGWAVAHGLLGPAARVALGVLAASLTAVGGYRLRRRERSFGSTLLGLALAMFHVCAWASGPLLRLVPPWIAFAFAAAASIALALFAYHEADEPLWCVGFGGAAIAPFVTSTGGGSAALLAAYGSVVLLSGCWALQRRPWTVAERVLGLGVALYVAALASMPERDAGPMLALALPVVMAVVAVTVDAPASHVRARLRAMGVLVAAAAVRAGLQSAPPFDRRLLGATIVLVAVLWLALLDRVVLRAGRTEALPGEGALHSFSDWLDACWLPLALVAAILAGFDVDQRGGAITFGASALGLLAFVWRRPFGELRDAAAFAASATAMMAAATELSERPMALTVAIAGVCVAILLVARLRPSRVWLVMSGLGLITCSLASLQFLVERTPYVYTPFGTRASAVALALAAAWGLVALLARSVARALRGASTEPAQDDDPTAPAADRSRRIAVDATRLVAIAWPYAWINVELAHAFSPATSMLLLISWYAVTAVASVWLGRRLSRPMLRHVGLALAVLAALVAFNGARGIDAVATRIAGYLVTAVFLLGIAYWYREGRRAEARA